MVGECVCGDLPGGTATVHIITKDDLSMRRLRGWPEEQRVYLEFWEGRLSM